MRFLIYDGSLISNFEILIATHSPILIGDRWDDVIELRDQVVN